ncbi:MAG: hypothetical protein V9G12_18425 [Microthrixaceae bacterium]
MTAPAPDLPGVTVELPGQPDGVSWPTLTWATGEQLTGDADRVSDVLDRAFATNPNPELALSLAFIAVQGGRIVAERYGPGVSATTPLTSWSVAKSITQSALGLALADGVVDLDAGSGRARVGGPRRSPTRHLAPSPDGHAFGPRVQRGLRRRRHVALPRDAVR